MGLVKFGSSQPRPLTGLECRALRALHSKPSCSSLTKTPSCQGKLVSGAKCFWGQIGSLGKLFWGTFCFGGHFVSGAFVLRGFLTCGLLHGGFCPGAFGGGILTRHRRTCIIFIFYPSVLNFNFTLRNLNISLQKLMTSNAWGY